MKSGDVTGEMVIVKQGNAQYVGRIDHLDARCLALKDAYSWVVEGTPNGLKREALPLDLYESLSEIVLFGSFSLVFLSDMSETERSRIEECLKGAEHIRQRMRSSNRPAGPPLIEVPKVRL